MNEVIVHKRAVKYLRRLPANRKEQIKLELAKLGEEPELDGTSEMKGHWQPYRKLRIGSYRVLYYYEESKGTIYVDYIGSRGDIYKQK